MFRFSLALIKMSIETCDNDHLKNSGEFINTIRENVKNCFDLVELKRIAFNEIKLPKRKCMATKRCFYVKQITAQSDKSLLSNKKASCHWFRRRSNETFSLTCSQYRIVISYDRSKVAILRQIHRSVNELSILSAQGNQSQSLSKPDLSLKSSLLIGVSNDGKRLLFTQFSSKTYSKVKNGIKIDLIGVNFDAIDGFYLEEFNWAIAICRSGLVCKCHLSCKQSDTIMVINDNTLSVVLAHLNADHSLIWLDSESSLSTHTFFAIDVNSLDVLRVIQSDFFSVHNFSDNPLNRISLIIVRSDPINGKIKRVINILTEDNQEKQISNFFDEVFDVNCVLLNNKTDTTEHQLSDEDFLTVLVTRNSFDIYVEYKLKSVWKKQMLFLNDINISELRAIRIINVSNTDRETSVALLVLSSMDAHLAHFNIRLN